MGIQVLADTVIAQIAAGEVVERPASVVKELMENAIDAGASNILVHIQGGGQRLIRISDDGSGIAADEVELAFARHATSKLRDTDDLNVLRTLGFRGEALSSISSVSQVTLTTRHRNDTIGTQLHIEGGVLHQQHSVGAPAGTIITVENLFFNTPARLKFLKKETTEKRYITSLVSRYAMAYPDIRFVLEQDGREVFRTSGTGQLADVIVKTMGLNNFRNMLEVDVEDSARNDRPEVAVYGFTSAPEYHRADRTHITLFVNGRWVQDSSLTYAVVQAYHGLMTEGRYPVAVLMISLPSHEVDVNVHPTKAEVRFRNANAVFATVQRGVRQAVLELASSPNVDSGYTTTPRFSSPLVSRRNDSHWFGGEDNAQLEMAIDAPEKPQSGGYHARQTTSDDDATAIPEGVGVPRKPRTLPVLRVVGQVGAMYIVAEGPAGMYLVDQNAAHARVLVDELLDMIEGDGVVATVAPDGVTIDVSAAEMRALDFQRDVLVQTGFVLEPFGPGTLTVRNIPEVLKDDDVIAVLKEIIKGLRDDPQMGESTIRDAVLSAVSTSVAWKSGQILNDTQMRQLVEKLERSRSPLVSPDDRPTLIHMSGDQLAREFKRQS